MVGQHFVAMKYANAAVWARPSMMKIVRRSRAVA
jgi:hypothetical protein